MAVHRTAHRVGRVLQRGCLGVGTVGRWFALAVPEAKLYGLSSDSYSRCFVCLRSFLPINWRLFSACSCNDRCRCARKGRLLERKPHVETVDLTGDNWCSLVFPKVEDRQIKDHAKARFTTEREHAQTARG